MKTLKSPSALLAVALIVGLVSFGASSLIQAQGTTPQSPSVWGDFLAGHHADAIGENRKAMEFYAAAARKGLPTSADLYSRMYVLALTEGQIDSALDALDKAEQLGAKAPLANLSRAVRALRDGDFQGAEVLLAADKSGLTHILAPSLTAWARVGRGDIPGALAALDLPAGTSAKKQGDKSKSPPQMHLLHAALINDRAGNAKAAGERFAQLRARSGLSVRSAQLSAQYFERQDRIPEAQDVYKSLGESAESLILIENLNARLKANKRPALDVSTAQHGAAEALYSIATALLGQNAWESALAMTYMADTLRPDFPAAAVVRAAALQESTRRDEANAIYTAIPLSSPFSWLARLQLADNLDRMDQTGRAVNLLTVMSRERDSVARPLIELGDVFRRNERFKEAADAYTRALARIDKPGEHHWRVFYSRGIAYEQSKRWPQAESDFLRALQLSPDQPLVLNYLGYSWVDQGQHLERAFKMITTAVEKRPRDGSIVDSLGWALYRTGDFPGAVKQLERAVMLRPADAILNDHLGDALWRVGRTREAYFQWRRALTMEPDAELIKTIEKKLKSGLPAVKP